MKVIFLSIIIILTTITFSFSQRTKHVQVYVKILDSLSNEKLEYATIQFCDAISHNMIYGGISDSLGRFVFDKVECKEYFVIISSIGYKTYKSKLKIPRKGNFYYHKVKLAKSVVKIDEVNVIAEQKGATVKIDKTVFIPDSLSLKNSTTGLDLLAKAPGVTVKKSDQSVKVLGNSNVLILIDGSNSDRSLIAIDPIDIERFEIIDNPSAKYDSDVANVINVILKEDRKKGLKISAYNYYYHSEYYRNFSNLQIEYEYLKIRIFGRYKLKLNKYNFIDTTNRISTVENIEYENNAYSLDNCNNSTGNTFQYGFDYYINKKNLLNFTGKYENNIINSFSNYLTNYNENSIPTHHSFAYSDYDKQYILQNYTLFYKKEFNKTNQELTFNTNYYIMDRNYETKQNTEFTYYDDNSITTSVRNENSKNLTNAINSKLDYSHPLNKKIYFDIGSQLYYRNINNNHQTEDYLSLFKYKDFRTAFYCVATYKREKISFQAGVRAENFNINIYDTIKFSQWNYLPTLSILYNFDNKNKLKLIFNKKLKYPRFHMLTPFTYYSNDSLSFTFGNPYLKPEKFTNIELNYSYKKKYTFISTSLYYKRYNDLIGINTNLNNNNVRFNTYSNISASNKYGGFVHFQFFLFKGLIQTSMYNTLFYNSFPDSRYNGLTYNMFFSLELQLPFDMYLIFDASYYGTEYFYNEYSYETPVIEEISISKSVLKDRGEITVGLADCFIPYIITDIAWTDDFREKNIFHENSNYIYIGFNYFFRKGKKIKKIKRELNMEADDE